MYYKINHGSITLGNNTVLEDINFCVKEHEKIGIVGRNGSGKTTLLKGIIGEAQLSDGYDTLSIEKVGDFNIGYVKQNTNMNLDITLLDYIKEAYKDILEIENKLNKLEISMSKKYNGAEVDKYNTLLNTYEYMGGYKYKKECECAIKKFGFTDIDKNKKLSCFSGGELTKISIIKLILSKPDLLILDEPTNHLDINTIEWLEDYLKNYQKSIIIVSHDRMFLDNVCNIIYNIEYGTLKRYSGNYTKFLKQKEEDYIKQKNDYEFYQSEVKRLQQIADRFRYKPSKASMAMSKLKQIERLEKVEKPKKENTKTFKINFNPKVESYKEVLKIKNLSIGYDKPLFNITLNVLKKDKIGIIGLNGIGKSTLIKTLIGELKPLSGKFVFGDLVNIGYFSQKLDNLNPNNTIYEEISNSFPNMSSNEIRSLLGSFLISGDDVNKKISVLSGGEKVRVSMCKILNKKPNVLIMDEPTNHLDILSKEQIQNLLKEYTGTIIMVSHDRYLIKNVCNRILELKSDGNFNLYNYGYQEYLEKRELLDEPKTDEKQKTMSVKKTITNPSSNSINSIEKEISKIEKEIQNLNNELLKEEVYMNALESKKITEKLNILNEKYEEKLLEWEELSIKKV